jgi:hypothetical protein
MNEIIKDILMILSGLIGGTLLILIKNKIFKKAKQEVIKNIPEVDKKQMIDLYNKGLMTLDGLKKAGLDVAKELNIKIPESFNVSKFTEGMTNITSKVGWAKDITSIFNLRKIIIVSVILGCIYGYGWYKGRVTAEAKFDLRGKEAIIQLNEHYLHIEKDGSASVIDKDGKILKKIRVQDIAGLREALRPYGLHLKPFFTAGGSLGQTGAKMEAGAGVDFFKWYKTNLNAFLTNQGVYLGVGYQITDNFDVLLGAGKGYKGDSRVYIGGKWKF